MTGMAVKVATAEEGRRLAQLLKADSAVAAVHPVVSTAQHCRNGPSASICSHMLHNICKAHMHIAVPEAAAGMHTSIMCASQSFTSEQTLRKSPARRTHTLRTCVSAAVQIPGAKGPPAAVTSPGSSICCSWSRG